MQQVLGAGGAAAAAPPASGATAVNIGAAPPSSPSAPILWHTKTSPAYILSAFVSFSVVLLMFLSVRTVSAQHVDALGHYLQPPWLFPAMSLGVDASDTQWRDFANIVPLLGPLLILLSLGARHVRAQYRSAPLLQAYYIASGFLFLLYVHGAPLAFALALMLVNYAAAAFMLSRNVPGPIFFAITWSAHIAILFVNDAYRGYTFSLFGLPAWLDALPHGRLRWHIVFNMSTLRMLAFNYDMYEASGRGAAERRAAVARSHATGCIECAQLAAAAGVPLNSSSGGNAATAAVAAGGVNSEMVVLAATTAVAPVGSSSGGAAAAAPLLAASEDESLRCYKFRTDAPRPMRDYNLRAYFAYLFYVPLFVAGPMSSFNAFASHTYAASRSFNTRFAFTYALRIGIKFLVLSFMLHHAWLNAIRRADAVFNALTVAEKCSMMFLTLGFLWLKFAIIWRFSRLIALIDGVEVPEDMGRCFSNTVSVQSFWQDWHASFNQWIVRYMYVPLGGSKRKAITVFPIFIFIAVWHDIELHLVWWALIMAFCLVPEAVVMGFFARPQMRWMRLRWWWPYFRALGGCCSIFVLIVANLIGYGTGTSNTNKGVSEMFSGTSAAMLLLLTFALFYSGAIVGGVDRDLAEAKRRALRSQFGLVSSSSSGKAGGAAAAVDRTE